LNKSKERRRTMRKVLIVDDNKSIRDLMRVIADEMGWETEVASDVTEAIRKINDSQIFDALITDNNMPSGNGKDVIKAAKSKNPNIRTILMTGLNLNKREKEEIERLGAEIWEKSVRLEQIILFLQ
jgi:DNA-binding NtrC family response regulator